ncbi:MAG: hypothetical protein V1724_00590, partial [Chloroflexota bacterium]
LGNEALLGDLAKSPDGPAQFQKLYLWLNRHPRWETRGRKRVLEGYWNSTFILTANGELKPGGDVWLPDVQASPSLAEMSNILQHKKPILHPQIMLSAADDTERATSVAS